MSGSAIVRDKDSSRARDRVEMTVRVALGETRSKGTREEVVVVDTRVIREAVVTGEGITVDEEVEAVTEIEGGSIVGEGMGTGAIISIPRGDGTRIMSNLLMSLNVS